MNAHPLPHTRRPIRPQHAPHDPYEAPQAYLDKFAHIQQRERQYYAAMVNLLDDHVGAVVAALKAKGLWDNLLWCVARCDALQLHQGTDYPRYVSHRPRSAPYAVDVTHTASLAYCRVSSADNGGPVGSGFGGNNFPLLGGKASNTEGGVRVNAYASGGFIPPARRGTVETAFMGIEDWYPTCVIVAGARAVADHACRILAVFRPLRHLTTSYADLLTPCSQLRGPGGR